MNTCSIPGRCASAFALTACAVLPGIAQAQSSVSVYGLMDLGIGYYRGGGVRQTRLDSGQDTPSRIGFRGAEDLGGGWSAVFKLEAGIAADTGGGAAAGGLAFNRESYVGLAGGFGQVVMGRVWSVTDDAWSVHRFSNFSAYIFPEFGNFDRTYGNAIKYTSPTMAGFQGTMVYSFGEAQGSTRPGSARELGLSYQGGPASVFASYSETRNLTSSQADKLSVLAGSYKAGPVLIRASYIDSKPRASGGKSAKAAMLGADYAFAPNWTIGADYLRRSVKGSNLGTGVARVLLNYEMSPRTGVYAYLARLTNRGGDTQSFTGLVGPDAGQTGFNVGLRHRF